jgi:hypothetical protein
MGTRDATLTPAQAAAIEGAHAEQMRRFGYLPPPDRQPPDGQPPDRQKAS